MRFLWELSEYYRCTLKFSVIEIIHPELCRRHVGTINWPALWVLTSYGNIKEARQSLQTELEGQSRQCNPGNSIHVGETLFTRSNDTGGCVSDINNIRVTEIVTKTISPQIFSAHIDPYFQLQITQEFVGGQFMVSWQMEDVCLNRTLGLKKKKSTSCHISLLCNTCLWVENGKWRKSVLTSSYKIIQAWLFPVW